jgi:ubiquinol-cytochrome c reductase cytochrome c subunit
MRMLRASLVLLVALVLIPSAFADGRQLYLEGCATCHGLDARGIPGRGPDLHGAGAAAADFYLSTGRMPLAEPTDQPMRSDPAYSRAEIDQLVHYIGSLGGPSIPDVHPEDGSVGLGMKLFSENCAGCHHMSGAGGIVGNAVAPRLWQATPTQVAEAVRTGPYVMPRFGPRQINDHQLASIVRYVELTKNPDDRGGWALGHVGPVPEGMVAWLLAGGALVLVARLIGNRAR